MVVFPAASKPTIRILISFFPHSLSNNFEMDRPMFAVLYGYTRLCVAWLLELKWRAVVYYLIGDASVSPGKVAPKR